MGFGVVVPVVGGNVAKRERERERERKREREAVRKSDRN